MKFRKVMALALAASMAVSLNAVSVLAEGGDTTDITLWTYPVGSWGDSAVVDQMISNFNEAHPEINVTVEYLDYTNGDDQINTAIEGGQAPDIVLEGPERLVANWGARGLMADLSDLWTDEAKEAIYDSVESACQNNDGVFYEYPLCMTAHTMAINKDIFEQAGALQYIDEETRTWTAEDFQKAVKAVSDLSDNDYLHWKGSEALTENAGLLLTGGTTGAVQDAAYQTFLDKIEPYSFNAVGCDTKNSTVKGLFANWTRRLRDEQGVKFQCVLHVFVVAFAVGLHPQCVHRRALALVQHPTLQVGGIRRQTHHAAKGI